MYYNRRLSPSKTHATTEETRCRTAEHISQLVPNDKNVLQNTTATATHTKILTKIHKFHTNFNFHTSKYEIVVKAKIHSVEDQKKPPKIQRFYLNFRMPN